MSAQIQWLILAVLLMLWAALSGFYHAQGLAVEYAIAQGCGMMILIFTIVYGLIALIIGPVIRKVLFD